MKNYRKFDKKAYILPVVAFLIVGIIAIILVIIYFYLSIPLDVFQKSMPYLPTDKLLTNYFSFQERILGQVAKIGGYIYSPIVPILSILIWNYIQRKND